MSALPLLLLWLLHSGKEGGQVGPAWPLPVPPPAPPPRPPGGGGTPGPAPSTTSPAPLIVALPDASWRPHPAPIPRHVIEVARMMLRSLKRGTWAREGEVIYRHEPHGGGRWGVTAYTRRA